MEKEANETRLSGDALQSYDDYPRPPVPLDEFPQAANDAKGCFFTVVTLALAGIGLVLFWACN